MTQTLDTTDLESALSACGLHVIEWGEEGPKFIKVGPPHEVMLRLPWGKEPLVGKIVSYEGTRYLVTAVRDLTSEEFGCVSPAGLSFPWEATCEPLRGLVIPHEKIQEQLDRALTALDGTQAAMYDNAEWSIKLLWQNLGPRQREQLADWLQTATNTARDLRNIDSLNSFRSAAEESKRLWEARRVRVPEPDAGVQDLLKSLFKEKGTEPNDLPDECSSA